ncbi:MAG: hypothetical protein KatS3mg058_2243 [Roseiflexus sp.]|nr:MAG: hypothetical protein KatS3mg058_2243 [Roseiflexus sp.]
MGSDQSQNIRRRLMMRGMVQGVGFRSRVFSPIRGNPSYPRESVSYSQCRSSDEAISDTRTL